MIVDLYLIERHSEMMIFTSALMKMRFAISTSLICTTRFQHDENLLLIKYHSSTKNSILNVTFNFDFIKC